MRFFLISDNSDAINGMRLAGIEGVVARTEKVLNETLQKVAASDDIGMLLVTEKIADNYTAQLDAMRKNTTGPLVITVPSTGGGAAGKDRITRYVREAIGIKI